MWKPLGAMSKCLKNYQATIYLHKWHKDWGYRPQTQVEFFRSSAKVHIDTNQ